MSATYAVATSSTREGFASCGREVTGAGRRGQATRRRRG